MQARTIKALFAPIGMSSVLSLCAFAHAVAGPPSTQPTAAAVWPDTSYEDLVLLVKSARRSFEHRMSSGLEASPRYRSPSLAGRRGIVHLVMRSRGGVIAESESNEMDIIDAANAAGNLLAKAVLDRKLRIEGAGRGEGLEFEWLGPREYLPDKYGDETKWSEGLLRSFEPAAEGIGVELDERRGWTRPSEIVVSCFSPDLALLAAEKRAGINFVTKSRRAAEIRYFRFPAVHLWQESAKILPVRLYRGETLVRQEQVSVEGIDDAIRALGEYLIGLQRKDGAFAQEYVLGADTFKPGYSGDRQLAGCVGLATLAEWTGDRLIADAAMRSARRISTHVRSADVEQAEGAATQPADRPMIVDFEEQQHCLEGTAKFCWSLERLGRPGELETQRAGLLKALLRAQAEDGSFELSFVQRQAGGAVDVRGACWTMLALGESVGPDGRRALEKAKRYYLEWWTSRIRALTGPGRAALARGFAQLYVNNNDARVSETCFEILNGFVGRQLRENNSPWRELWGGIGAEGLGVVGIDTAHYVTALADGVRLAERIGDRARADDYRNSIAKAVRFVLQLQFSREGCFYVRFPQDVQGAVRAAPWDHHIRVDHCADALIALIRAREVLFGRPSPR